MKLLPMEYNVVIRPDNVEEVTKGGIILSTRTVEADKFAVQTGEVIALSPHAFSYADWPEGARKPVVGDRVVYGKYKGSTFGKDADEVRIVKDKDIDAIIEEAADLRAVA